MEKTTTPPCAACKYLRRKCIKDCVFAPYFSTDKQENYEAVHKVFGASHVAKFINDLHPSKRETAMHTLAWEARVRLNDPVNGCSAIINSLHRKLQDLEDQVAIAKKELASYGIVPTFVPPPPTAYQQIHHNPMPPPPTAYQQTHHNPMPPPPIAYQQIHHNPMMSATPNNDGFLTAQQSQDEAHRFASTQTAQMQQTQETQTQHNESVTMNNVRDKKVNGPHKQG